ncbi:MAG: EAL domain-containing protein [Desulfuromonadales bacterium]
MIPSRLWHGAEYPPGIAATSPEDQEPAARPSILIVDDDPGMRKSVQEMLAAYGYDCLSADGGKKALEFLGRQHIDLLLLDLSMPGIDGYQVLDSVRENHSGTAVIIVSGQTSFDSATLAMRSGAQDFLRKPYVPDELVRAVENVLQKRSLEQNVKKIHQELKNSEQRHRFIVNNSPDIIYMLDAQGCFSFINDRVRTLLGYNPEELIGSHYSCLVYQEDYNRAKYALAERRTGNRASRNVEFRMVPKDGNHAPRSFESRSVPIELSSMGVYVQNESQDKRRFIGTYGVVRDITERKRAEEMINFQLNHDLLTRLPNRNLFRDRFELFIAQAKRHDAPLAVMFLDIDRFKAVNDSLGHLLGDELLQVAANRLRECLRESDTLARVGGDEFNLLLAEIGSAEDVSKVANKILHRFQEPVLLQGTEVFVSFSMGIALYPKDGTQIDTLIKHADAAMYHVKENGKKGFRFFSEEMTTLHTRNLSIESGLRRALEKDQFRVLFQPQMDVATNRIVGVEALLRWLDPHEGLILPGEFIPLAEETGLICEIGKWMLDNACATMQRWSAKKGSDLILAVNISARQLLQSDFQQQVLDALERHDLPCHLLELEITENVLMQDMEKTASKLRELAQRGVRIAVDDFGTGYSSLSYLQSLPLNTLKIDRSFISEIRSTQEHYSIVNAIISMAEGLELNLVAEGVETQTQLQYLRNLCCPNVQGYLIAPPSPADEMMDRIFHDIPKGAGTASIALPFSSASR